MMEEDAEEAVEYASAAGGLIIDVDPERRQSRRIVE